MKPQLLAITFVLAFGLLLVTACAGLTSQVPILLTPSIAANSTTGPLPENSDTPPALISPAGSIEDSAGLMDALSAQGVSVKAAGNIDQPFFSVHGQSLKVNGADVQVFEYVDATAANQEAALVSRDGSSVGTTMVSWMAAPHFYKAGKVIVLYVGTDTAITATLQTILGPQFAGA